MGIAERQDKYKYLEDRIDEHGGEEHLKESDEWFLLIDPDEDSAFDFPGFDVYMHRSRFFRATVHFGPSDDEDSVYDQDTVTSIRVELTRPKHHYAEDEPLPPIHDVYSKDPADEE